MPARDRRASTIDLTADLSDLSPQRAREFLAAALEANAKSGVLRLSSVPSGIVRSEASVNIHRQLELSIGGSAKGIIVPSCGRSDQDGSNPFNLILSTRA